MSFAAPEANPLKLLSLTLAALTVSVGFAALAPPAQAFTWCSELLNGTFTDGCQHYVCVGRSWRYEGSRRYEHCGISEDGVLGVGPGTIVGPCRLCDLLP